MSREIDYITNVTAFAELTSDGDFSIQGGFPTNPDEVVIRQITYHGDDAAKMLYLLHSNIGNQFIGCVSNTSGFVTNPVTRIQTRNPLPNVLTFKLFLATSPVLNASPTPGDQICICMDFIKYK